MKSRIFLPRLLSLLFTASVSVFAQSSDWLGSLPQPHNYTLKRVSSFDRSGGNADFRAIPPGETLTVLDEPGPRTITHILVTLAHDESYHLKKMVLRIYWDEEATPSVETPLGDFFGLGLGEYFLFQSAPLSVGPNKALNRFFPIPFRKPVRISVPNNGKERAAALFFHFSFPPLSNPLP